MIPADLVLLRPEWLLAIPVALLAALLLGPRARGLSGWDKAVDPHLMEAMRGLGHVVPGAPGRRAALPAATAVCIAAALSGPAIVEREAAAWRNLDGLVIAFDLSASMTEGGYLREAKAAAEYVASRAGARPTALIVFAGDAYRATTFTADHATIGSVLAALEGGIVPDPGSRPARALEMALSMLETAKILAGDVVLISDGEGAADASGALIDRFRAADVPVSVLRAPGGPAGDAGLETLALRTGGASGSLLAPAPVADFVAQSPSDRLARMGVGAAGRRDLGRWLLLAAAVPALMMFRRRG